MLINFTIGNYRSFREAKTLSMEAASITELKESVIIRDNFRLLPSAVLYGANSSGKSNLLNAISKFKDLVTTSSKLNSTDKLALSPFLLNTKTIHEPSYFEIELWIDSQVYRYGFTADNNRFYDEWLYVTEPNAKEEKCLFVRTSEGIGVLDDFAEGKGLENKTRDNALFLSVVDSFNGVIAKKLIFAIDHILILSGINHEQFANLNHELCHYNEKWQMEIENFFQSLDLGFRSFEIPDDRDLAKKVKAYTVHNLYGEDGKVVGETRLNMKEHESSGTNKVFDIASVLVGVLDAGWILVIDELDSKLHPLLTKHIIRLFNDKQQNASGAQLIFATHDTNLLNIKTFRRDQIWFTEKDETEATDLYSLVEFKEPGGNKIRKDRSLEKDYINGRYGAIPYIKN